MNRRNFIKLLGLSPLAGLLGCRKEPEVAVAVGSSDSVTHYGTVRFDPSKDYRVSRRYIFKEEKKSAHKVALSEICDFVPEEYQDKIHGLCHDPIPNDSEPQWRTGQIVYHYSPDNIPRSKLAEWIKSKRNA
jgi:hypothetical protein